MKDYVAEVILIDEKGKFLPNGSMSYLVRTHAKTPRGMRKACINAIGSIFANPEFHKKVEAAVAESRKEDASHLSKNRVMMKIECSSS